jgi:hypothetical protein
MELKRQHDAHCRLHWLGVMITQFTDAELALLASYLSAADRELLRSAGRGALKSLTLGAQTNRAQASIARPRN